MHSSEKLNAFILLKHSLPVSDFRDSPLSYCPSFLHQVLQRVLAGSLFFLSLLAGLHWAASFAVTFMSENFAFNSWEQVSNTTDMSKQKNSFWHLLQLSSCLLQLSTASTEFRSHHSYPLFSTSSLDHPGQHNQLVHHSDIKYYDKLLRHLCQ